MLTITYDQSGKAIPDNAALSTAYEICRHYALNRVPTEYKFSTINVIKAMSIPVIKGVIQHYEIEFIHKRVLIGMDENGEFEDDPMSFTKLYDVHLATQIDAYRKGRIPHRQLDQINGFLA